jgi:hypothetical protein
MRIMLLVVGIFSIVVVGVTRGIIPIPRQLAEALVAPGADRELFRRTNANPYQAYASVLPQILSGKAGSATDARGSAAATPVVTSHGTNSSTTVAREPGQSRTGSNDLPEVQRNNARLQDILAAARNPGARNVITPH